MFQGIRHTSLFPEARGVLSRLHVFFFMGDGARRPPRARRPFARSPVRPFAARPPADAAPPAVSLVCARGRTRAVGVGREQQRREALAGAVQAVGGALCARGGRWRAQNSPGAHRSHGAHGGRAASWEQCDGIAWGGISSRVARRRLELLEKLGDGAGAGVGGGAEAALRGAATRWPWWAALTEVEESASLHLSTREFDSL